MNQRKTYGVIGTGSIGGFVGFKLLLAGQEVHFLARSNYAQIKQKGLTLISGSNQTHLSHVQVYQTVNSMPKCDVLLLTTKTTSNTDIASQLKNALKPGGLIIVLQNGIGYEKMFADRLKDASIAGGLCYIKSSLTDSTIKHFSQQAIHIAPFKEDKGTPAITKAAEDLRTAGITVVTSQDLNTLRWKKLIFNMAFNGLSVVLNTTMHNLLKNKAYLSFVSQIIDEGTEAAIKCGAKFTKADILAEFEKIKSAFLSSPDSVPSMKEDFVHGRPMELDSIYRNTLLIAREHGAKLPLVSNLYWNLCKLQTKKQKHYSSTPVQSNLMFANGKPANTPPTDPVMLVQAKL